MLLCPPDHFEVAYVINPWMDPARPVDKAAATEQWNALRDKLRELGVDVQLIDPVPGLPDMTFAGDGGIAYGRTFVPSNFRHPERAPEAAHYERWFRDHGYRIERMPPEVIFEGLGDITLNSGYGVTSYGQRSTADAVPQLRRLFPDVQWLASLELVDPTFFHIGVALQLLDGNTGMYVPDAFSAEGRKEIENLPHHMIAVSDEDARNMTVNAVVVGRDLVVNHCSRPVRRELADRGFRVHRVDVSEFVKSGGATRCLVLALDY
jgi:N-dimethylarginine dimethylaminohydrolase